MRFIHASLYTVFAATILFAGGNTMIPDIGTKAPDFALVSSNGDTVRLDDFAEKNYVVLIFYPGDETPGCTKQLCAVRDDYAAFEAKAAKVFGVNPADAASHQKFIKKQSYQFPLLIDEGQKAAKLYGCDGWPMVKRTVFVINKQGIIVYAKNGLPTNDEILKSIPDEK
jgi:peroxiredoxin Q/BCP